MRKLMWWYRLVPLAAAISLLPLLPGGSVFAKSDAERRKELLEQLNRLNAREERIDSMGARASVDNQPAQNIEEVIAPFEALIKSCGTNKTQRCADALYTLAYLYQRKEQNDFIARRESYEKSMDEWEKRHIGNEPVNPTPDYSKSLRLYQQLLNDYPDFPKLSEALYQMGHICELMGNIDRCKEIYTRIIDSFPRSPRAALAHFKRADFEYMEHDNDAALKDYEAIGGDNVDLQVQEMTTYRKAELHYNRGDFDQALDLFKDYIDQCDAGIFKKKEFRSISLEYLGITFSDLPNGGQACLAYFAKIGHREFEDTVLYTVGRKNYAHGQWDDAIRSLQLALEHFPYFKDAPVACQRIVECNVIKKRYAEANAWREKLIDNYGPGSAWYEKNKDNPVARDLALNERMKTLSSIAIFYHVLANQKKDKSAYEKALKRYEDFFREFPDNKWKNYEFHYNVAEIYDLLGDCGKAAENYEFVAAQDISKFPPYQRDLDTFGMSAEEIEKLKRSEKSGPVLVSQEDAAYNTIVSLDNCRKKAMAAQKGTDEQIYRLPQTKKLLESIEKFQQRFPNNPNASDLLYLAASVHYNAKSYDDAIRLFRRIAETYPAGKVAEPSLRMLANSYSSLGQFDLAMSMYHQLIAKQKADSPEQAEVVDLAAGSMYKKGESLLKHGDTTAAALEFKSIAGDYPNSQIADKAWSQAGALYETRREYTLAAQTFEELTTRFPKSALREKSFLRAAENYKAAGAYDKAALVYQAGAEAITKPEFAIFSLSAASECFQKLNQYDMAGKMFRLIYDRYAKDPKTPAALYNAGLMFEKGKLYDQAIAVYSALSRQYPESDYAAEAFFSIGLCYEKLGRNAEMASTFIDYAGRYTADRYKQVHALVKAGNALLAMGKPADAEKNYRVAVSIYEKFHKGNDIDVGDIAETYCRLGDIYFGRFSRIQLKGRTENEVKARLKEKTGALEEPAGYYGQAIGIGVEEWTIRSTYMIGEGFVNMAEAIDSQTLFGNAAEQVASKVKILSSLEKYYDKAQGYFSQNIKWAHEQNIANDSFADRSVDRFMEMMYRKGDIMEEVGRILKRAPVPANMSKEEKAEYAQVLEEKWLEAQDAALPHYEQAARAAKEFGIAQNRWLDKTWARIRDIKPDDEVLSLLIMPWKPAERQEAAPVPVMGSSREQPDASAAAPQGSADRETQREVRRIDNIMGMDISPAEKMTQLNRIEMDAKRNIELEIEKINELKLRLGR